MLNAPQVYGCNISYVTVSTITKSSRQLSGLSREKAPDWFECFRQQSWRLRELNARTNHRTRVDSAYRIRRLNVVDECFLKLVGMLRIAPENLSCTAKQLFLLRLLMPRRALAKVLELLGAAPPAENSRCDRILNRRGQGYSEDLAT